MAEHASTVLWIGDDPGVEETLRRQAEPLGFATHACAEVDDALRLCARHAPAAVVVDVERAGDDVADWCRALRERHARAVGRRGKRRAALSILALTSSGSVADAERLFRDGVDDCVTKPVRPERLAWTLTRRLRATRPEDEDGDFLGPVPEVLREAFRRVGRRGRLADAGRIHSGVTVRHPTFRRMAPLSPEWVGALSADEVGRFALRTPSAFVKFSAEALARRPASEEYKPEKVLIRRVAPPVVAAVDAGERLFGTDVLSVVPGEGFNAGYLACALNGRLADFWFNRLWERGRRSRATLLEGRDLGMFPLPRPGADDRAFFHRAGKLLTYYGPRPLGASDRRRRAELWEAVNARLFALYEFDAAAIRALSALFF